MSKFRVTYPSGEIEETEQSDCDTLEHFINVKFGSADYASNGVTVEHIQNIDDVVQAGYPVVIDEDVLAVQDAAYDASLVAAVESVKAEGMAEQDVVDALIAPVFDEKKTKKFSAQELISMTEELTKTKKVDKKKKVEVSAGVPFIFIHTD